jgi:hypothetical protein
MTALAPRLEKGVLTECFTEWNSLRSGWYQAEKNIVSIKDILPHGGTGSFLIPKTLHTQKPYETRQEYLLTLITAVGCFRCKFNTHLTPILYTHGVLRY